MIIGAWVVILALSATLFHDWIEEQFNPNQQPTRPTGETAAGTAIELAPNRYGHYVASGVINGEPVVFLLDTGATTVALPAVVAERLGLRRGQQIMMSTANGMSKGYRTRLNQVGLGAISLSGVDATIAPGMSGEEVLLGMSFLERLNWQRNGDRLVLSKQE
ncbi:MAG: TIGR02281 family clan AA aspartic protease [Chromatiales bacterium]|nr:TIGR02281 family clan AA aspartic protease [Chromatiales bacterium]